MAFGPKKLGMAEGKNISLYDSNNDGLYDTNVYEAYNAEEALLERKIDEFDISGSGFNTTSVCAYEFNRHGFVSREECRRDVNGDGVFDFHRLCRYRTDREGKLSLAICEEDNNNDGIRDLWLRINFDEYGIQLDKKVRIFDNDGKKIYDGFVI